MPRVDFSTVEDDYRLLPEGQYPAVVTDIRYESGAETADNPGGNGIWNVAFEINPPDGKGNVKVSKRLQFYGKPLRFAWKHAGAILGRDLARDDSFDDEDWQEGIGASVVLTIEHWTRQDGSKANSIANIMKAGPGNGNATGLKSLNLSV